MNENTDKKVNDIEDATSEEVVKDVETDNKKSLEDFSSSLTEQYTHDSIIKAICEDIDDLFSYFSVLGDDVSEEFTNLNKKLDAVINKLSIVEKSLDLLKDVAQKYDMLLTEYIDQKYTDRELYMLKQELSWNDLSKETSLTKSQLQYRINRYKDREGL